MRRILCVWLPNWPIQRLLAARPELRGQALVLYARGARQEEQVMACCPAAQSRGIQVGMPLSEALAMSGNSECGMRNAELKSSFRIPHSEFRISVELYDPEADRAALEQLADACDRFSPLVGLEAAEPPECLLLDITGLGPLFGGEESLAAGVAQLCSQRGYQPSIAVADTPGAAWALAHGTAEFGMRNTESESPSPLWGEGRGEGKSAPQQPLTQPLPRGERGTFRIPNSEFRIPAPLVVPSGQFAPALAPLPVAALRLPEATVDLLRKLGIVYIAQLRSLPRESLRSRFGQDLIRRLDQALGAMPEVIVARRTTEEPMATWALEYPTAHRETLGQALGLLTRRVAEQLAARGWGVLELVCQLDCSGQNVSLRVGLFQPTALVEHLLELVGMQLELLRLPGAVSRLAVTATRTAPLVERQHELFADEPRERQRQLAVLVDRLSSRLGPEQVVRPRLRAEAQPEAAVGYEAVTKTTVKAAPSVRPRRTSRRRTGPSADQSVEAVASRPLRLFFPPLPLEVMAVVPDGPPVRMKFAGQSHAIAHHWGPERIETAWWRGRSVRRDYYRVETAEGSRFWVFRRLTDGEWFLHGEFE
jgi:protein ImuB